MFDYVIQNFNLVSFAIALAAFIIISAVSRILTSLVMLRHARKRSTEAQAHLNKLQSKLRLSDEQVREIIKKKESK